MFGITSSTGRIEKNKSTTKILLRERVRYGPYLSIMGGISGLHHKKILKVLVSLHYYFAGMHAKRARMGLWQRLETEYYAK